MQQRQQLRQPPFKALPVREDEGVAEAEVAIVGEEVGGEVPPSLNPGSKGTSRAIGARLIGLV